MSELYIEGANADKEIVRVDAPFDVALSTLRENGAQPITPRDLANYRIQVGNRHLLNTHGSWTSAGFLYAKDANPLLALASPLLDSRLAELATQANKEGRYFSTEDGKLYDDYLKKAEDDKNKSPEERSVLILPSRVNIKISPTINPEIFNGVFKDKAEEYLKFTGFSDLEVYLVDEKKVNSQNGSLLTQLWLHGLYWVGRSDLCGVKDLYHYGRVRGVRVSAEGSVQKFLKNKKLSYIH